MALSPGVKWQMICSRNILHEEAPPQRIIETLNKMFQGTPGALLEMLLPKGPASGEGQTCRGWAYPLAPYRTVIDTSSMLL